MGKKRRLLPEPLQFIQFHNWMLDSEAFQALSGIGFKLMATLARRFNGHNNGRICLGVRDAAAEMGCAINTASRAFHELEAAGFIECVTRGAFSVKYKTASEWLLTWLIERDRATGADLEPRKTFLRKRPGMIRRRRKSESGR